jgi:hypothetical protein
MITLTEIIVIIIIHWVADFVFQDKKWALGKSKNWNDLLTHTSIYSLIWFLAGMIYLAYSFTKEPIQPTSNLLPIFIFTVVTFITHTITDYFTSRIVIIKFENKHYGSAIPNFGAFTIIDIDQVLHYIQLFITYYLLKS